MRFNIPNVLCFCLISLSMAAQAEIVRCQFEAIKEFQPKSIIFSEREELVSTIYGFDIMIDPKDQRVSKEIKTVGCYRPENIRTFGRLIKPGDTILSVGSHVGLAAIIYTKIAGPNAKLFIIEPYSVSFKLASQNVFTNDLAPVSTLYRKAVSNRTGKGELLINLDDTSAALLAQEGSKASIPRLVETQSVEVDLIDNILPEGTQIDFAIIDVRRLEVQALEGMKKTIANSPNLRMVVRWPGFSLDMEQEQFLSRARAVLSWIRKQNFQFYRVKREDYWLPPLNCNDQMLMKISIDEILCLTKKRKVIIDLIIMPRQPPHRKYWTKTP